MQLTACQRLGLTDHVARSLGMCVAGRWLFCMAWAPCVISSFLVSTSQAEIPFGKSNFAFQGAPGKPLTVYTYRPTRHDRDDPVLIVMHGAKRNAADYRKPWIAQAERLNLMLLLPEFSKRTFPNREYQQVGVLDEAGSLLPKGRRSPELIEQLFDHVVDKHNLSAEKYYLYGHSAGGQFVHRMMLLRPSARVALAIPANAGWYTLPTLSKPYPEGLSSTDANGESLAHALSRNVVVLLGDGDTNADHRLLPRQEAARRQGPHRLARGQFFYKQLLDAAASLDCQLNWTVKEIPGVAHSNEGMAKHAADLIEDHLGQTL